MSGKKGHCQTCDYIRSHRGGNRVNEDLTKGISISAIMQRTGLGRRTLTRHRDEGHMMAGFQKHAHLTKGAKEQLDLMRCATEIFMDCKDSAEKAKKKAEQKSGKARDFKDAMGCWDNAVKSMEVLAKVSPDGNKETESDGMIEALKATAKDDWKDTRVVSLATTEPEAADGTQLDAA